jgi:FixJ family two-component response regulator
MLYFPARMPVVFVIARDWTLRTSVRAELLEAGVRAMGMESADEVGTALAEGELPAVLVVEAISGLADDAQIKNLIARVPAVLVVSRAEAVAVPPAAAVLYRPVRIREIVAKVEELMRKGHAA